MERTRRSKSMGVAARVRSTFVRIAVSDRGPRFLLYSHDGLGLGHTRRNLAIAAALRDKAPDAPILLATGTDDAHRLGLPRGVDILKLPSLRKVANGHYKARRLRVSTTDVHALRSNLLIAAVKTFHPDVVLVDKHPLGAGGELRGALDALRAAGGRTVLGLRDILDDPATVFQEWEPYDIPARIAEWYDRVLVYGDPIVFDPIRAYLFPEAVARRTSFTGYVVAPPEEPPFPEPDSAPVPARPHDRPVVLATAGGGEDGSVLLEAFLRASKGASWSGIAVCGPMMPPEDEDRLRSLASECGTAFHGFVPGLSGYLGRADVIVAMGGYNTLAEAASRGIPIVCVPRTEPRKEQLMRALAFERLGVLRLVDPDHLNPSTLRESIDATLRAPDKTPGPVALPWDGAARAATELLQLAEAPARPAASVRA